MSIYATVVKSFVGYYFLIVHYHYIYTNGTLYVWPFQVSTWRSAASHSLLDIK